MKKLILNTEQYNKIKNQLSNKVLKITESQLEYMVNGYDVLTYADFAKGIKMIIGTEKYDVDFINNFYEKTDSNKTSLLSKMIALGLGDIDDQTNTFIVNQDKLKDKLDYLYNFFCKNDRNNNYITYDTDYNLDEAGEDDFKIKKFYKNGVYLPKPFNIVHKDDDNTYCLLKNINGDVIFLDYSKIDKNDLIRYSDDTTLEYNEGKFNTKTNNIYSDKTINNWFDNNYDDIDMGMGIDGYYNGNNCVLVDDEVVDYIYDITNEDKLLTFKKQVLKDDDVIDEATTASSAGAYVGPAMWAKNKANHIYSQKPAISGGKLVEFDDCTKINNNKVAQNGGCSQGAIDNVVKIK